MLDLWFNALGTLDAGVAAQLGIIGVTLHSYRYAVAEHAKTHFPKPGEV